LKLGYKLINKKSINSNKKWKYFIKPRSNESIPHFFLIYDIQKFLKEQKIKVELYQTLKPDLIFTLKNKKYAIEVETGSLLKTNRKALTNKIENLNKTYGKNWIFVVTNRKLAATYAKLGPTTDIRYIKNILLKIIKNS